EAARGARERVGRAAAASRCGSCSAEEELRVAYRDIDLSVRCPHCAADAGRRCVITTALTRGARELASPHVVRVLRANDSLAETADKPDGLIASGPGSVAGVRTTERHG